MQILYGIRQIKTTITKCILGIGVFDGVHRGHQRLMQRVVQRAQKLNVKSVIMTFHPHPVHVLHPEIDLPLIVSLDYRLKLIAEQGVDICIVVPFTKKFSLQDPEEFIQEYLLKRIAAQEVIVGEDFRFGRNRSGTFADFEETGRKYGLRVAAISVGDLGKKTVSSSVIRELISVGDLKKAARLLKRPVSMMGVVIHGDSRGKILGFPTANIQLSDEVLPPLGVYFVCVRFDGKVFPGVANLGRRPSFKSGKEVVLEVHLLDFRGRLYGKKVILQYLKKVREEKYFPSIEVLKKQIQKDVKLARAFFQKR